jgi:hypothetical protein
MGFLKKLEKFDKRIKELQKIEEKRVKEEQRARIKEGTEGKYQAQITYTLVVLLTLIPFCFCIKENFRIGIGDYLLIVFFYALTLGLFTFVRSWMYYHRFFSSSTISKWRKEGTLFNKKLRYSAIRGGIVFGVAFIIQFIFYFF